jgi:hypothetical protein
MSAAQDVVSYTSRIKWVTNAKITDAGSPGETYYRVFNSSGMDITSEFTPNTPKANFLTTEYFLSPSQRTEVLASLNRSLAAAQAAAKAPTAAQQAALLESLGLGPIRKQGALLYNISAPKTAYLHSGTNTDTSLTNFADSYGASPKVIAAALELWKNSANHKGMITTWNPPSTVPQIDAQKVSGMGTYGKKDPNKYAFQFLYNPQPITMAYRGAPPIDVSQYTSGSEEYALWGGGGSGGTINFDLYLLRMYDMPYYKKVGDKGVCTDTSIYTGRKPLSETTKGTLFNEQDAIYNRGTMYDLEFLFRTVLGITMDSQLRGKTADIGWIGAMPVELHLGPGLRYWGTLNGLTVNHLIFNERMVPVFSTVSIEFNRLPDYNWAQGNPPAGATIAGGKLTSLGNGAYRVKGAPGGKTLQ